MYKKHVFVCENIRDLSGRKSCGKVGASIRTNLKREIVSRKLNKEIRINRSGCLGKWSQGPCVVVYPKGDWHLNTKVEKCKKIIDQFST